jgi:hypothetical protein
MARDAGTGDRSGARRAAGITDPDANSELEIVFCGGNAQPTDTHLAVTVHCVDDEIIEWLARREWRKGCAGSRINRPCGRQA